MDKDPSQMQQELVDSLNNKIQQNITHFLKAFRNILKVRK